MKPITIVGGGLAGLSLGILLRQREVPVTIHEAGQYPRHRVCGEFLSGQGQEVLEELGVLSRCLSAGRLAHSVSFANEVRQGSLRPLPRPALCLSRHHLDALLAEEFVQRGGDLRSGERIKPAPDLPGQVQAHGRRASGPVGGWHWFGVKAHAQGVHLGADLELHVSAGAYVGLCRLADDRVNVCGLFRRKPGEAGIPVAGPLDWLRGRPGSPRYEQLAHAVFDLDSLCTVGGLDLTPRPAEAQPGLSIGDALTLIPPFTGNGMSLALESARWAVEPVTAFARGELAWDTARVAYARHADHHSRSRLRWASFLQRLMFLPLASPGLLWITRSDRLWRRLFGLTRDL